jgi:CheY-like chemotaxis protein
VVLMDINFRGMNGVECVSQLKAALPSTQFLMLTVYEDSDSLSNPQGRCQRLSVKRTARAAVGSDSATCVAPAARR